MICPKCRTGKIVKTGWGDKQSTQHGPYQCSNIICGKYFWIDNDRLVDKAPFTYPTKDQLQ